MKTTINTKPKIATPEKWLAARLELLREEKEFTHLRERITQHRRELPWVKHFMFGPGWEEGCKSCSFMMDHFNPTVPHLKARDVSFAAISHAPLSEILPFKARMGWDVNWVSSHGTDFNFDFHVSFTEKEMASGQVEYNYTKMPFPSEEAPGISVFARDAAGTVYHTYSTYSRGVDVIMATYNLLDLVPKGRDEDGLEYGMEWVRYHDRYEPTTAAR